MARSVENTSDLMRLPNTMMPLHSSITLGTRSANWRSVPVDRRRHLRGDAHVARRRHLAVRGGGRIVAHTTELQRFIVRCGVRQDLRVLGHIKNEITIFAHSDTSLSFWGSMS